MNDMETEAMIERIARAIAKAYASGWKHRGGSAILSPEDWAQANWESFCGEAAEVVIPEKMSK